MAKIDIETYRGFEITFNTDDGKFSAWSDSYDNEFAKPSFSSVKKGVDAYIKENKEFRPFKIQQLFDYEKEVSMVKPPIRVVGMRKDNNFVVDVGGELKQLSKYEVKKYVVYNPENDKIAEELKSFKKREAAIIAKLKGEKSEILSRVIFTKTLQEKRDEILNQ